MVTHADQEGWVAHNGRGCPLAIGTACRVVIEGAGGVLETDALILDRNKKPWDWRNYGQPLTLENGMTGPCPRVLRYRVIHQPAMDHLRTIAAHPGDFAVKFSSWGSTGARS